MTIANRPTGLRRLNPFTWFRPRAAWIEGGQWERHDLLDSALTNPEARRLFRSHGDIVATYGAVFAAIRRRARAVAKPRVVLVRDVRGEEVEIEEHPALTAFRAVNESLTFKQGFGLIEQHKLTHGKAYWVKRRNGLGVPVEFEIWPPDEVRPVPNERKPWVPIGFERKRQGSVERVLKEDIVWFRHMVDPRDPLNGLSPIGAVRVEVDTGLEAQRFNQRYFDNAMHIGSMFTAEEAGPGEIDRITQDLERKFKGVDRAYRAIVTGGNLKSLDTKPPHKDMEFLTQQQWGVEEVSRVFEMQPELLGLGNRTYENAPEAERSFWAMIQDQVDATLDEFNEFYLWPDFGDEFRFIAKYDNIPALQDDLKLRAEIDEINLRSGRTFINEVRERDGEEPVEWGEVPIMPLNMVSFGSIPTIATPGQLQTQDEPRARGLSDMRRGWERRFSRELRALIKHLETEDRRAIVIGDADSFNWDWWAKYGAQVIVELESIFAQTLASQGFVETPLLSAKELAVRWATQRAGELLRLEGRDNIVKMTRDRVKMLVAEAIDKGDSVDTLSKKLQSDFAFSKSRSDMIAVTETRSAQTQASLKSYQSQGTEGKEWLTAGDERVDGGNPSGPCISAENEGPIPIGRSFNNGLEGPPAHPRCRCTLLPVRELPRG